MNPTINVTLSTLVLVVVVSAVISTCYTLAVYRRLVLPKFEKAYEFIIKVLETMVSSTDQTRVRIDAKANAHELAELRDRVLTLEASLQTPKVNEADQIVPETTSPANTEPEEGTPDWWFQKPTKETHNLFLVDDKTDGGRPHFAYDSKLHDSKSLTRRWPDHIPIKWPAEMEVHEVYTQEVQAKIVAEHRAAAAASAPHN